MKNYRDNTPQTCCGTCRHSFDVEFFDGTDLRCAESCDVSAEQLSKERMTNKYKEIQLMLDYDESLRVAWCGLCDLYEKK